MLFKYYLRILLPLTKGKNKTVVEYSLAGYLNPIGVAEWRNQIARSLPEEVRISLPSIEEIEKELEKECNVSLTLFL